MFTSNILFKCIVILFSVNVLRVKTEEPCIIKTFNKISDAVKNCADIILDSISVPGGQQLTLNLQEGSKLTFRGNTTFNFYEWTGPLMYISGTNITVIGEKGSVLDGQGPLWWNGQGTWGTTKPKFATLTAENSIFDGLNIKNCPVGCIGIRSSQNVIIRNWKIDNLAGDEGVAPENKFGHNTDGFGIGRSENVTIEDSSVYNQDDCVVFNSGKNITVRNMFCHGSHGLSISINGGTLEDVLVENSVVTMAENGIHVKTHIEGAAGLIKNVAYRNITLLDCKFYGINVQQNYRNIPGGEPQDAAPENNVPIYNLTMTNIYGNVLAGAVPVFVLCAEEGCFDWQWNEITIFGAQSNNCTNYIPDGYQC